MGRQWSRILVALFLIVMGGLALASNLNLIPLNFLNVEWFWMTVFGLAGVIFLAVYANNMRDNWWAVIPGLTLLGLALLIGVPFFQGEIGGGMFLGMIGLSFWVIYFTRREFWWAIIPGGVLLTLALVASVSGEGNGMDTGGFFFLGIALTFLVVYFLPTAEGRMRWAIWPAGVLGIMGALLLTSSVGLARFVWPAFLILFGGLMVFRAMRPKHLL